MGFIEKIGSNMIEIKKKIESADHLVNIQYQMIGDGKILGRVLEEVFEATKGTISLILQYEYLQGNVELSKDSNENLKNFFSKCALKYRLNELKIKKLEEILSFYKKHLESGFEFTREGNLVVLDDLGGYVEINSGEIEQFTAVCRELFLAFETELLKSEKYK